MQVVERIKTGFKLTVRSLAIIRHNRALMAYPVLMLLVSALVAPLLLAVILGGLTIEAAQGSVDEENPGIAVFVGIFIAYLVFTFISTFFSTALVHASHTAFRGEPPDIRQSLKAASRSLMPILVWSVIAGTVGLFMQRSQRRMPWLTALISTAWAALTFFIVPVIALEEASIRGMFSRSARIFKERWGETAVGVVGAGIVQFAVALIGGGIIGLSWLMFESEAIVLILGVITAIAAFLVGTTVNGVIKTALYLYARDKGLPAELADINPDQLVQYRSGSI